MEIEKILLFLVLIVGVVIMSGCISGKQPTTTTSTISPTTTSSISSTSIMTTSTTPILRPIDIICPDDLEDFKERVEKNLQGEGVDEWFYKPITHKELGCSGNSIYCNNCSFFYPSFILTRQYNLTKLEVKARQKNYLIEKDGGFATKLAIIKKVSEIESYWIGIKDVKANVKGHDVIAYQTGECCLDKEHIRSQVKEMMNDLDLEYSGLDESRIERAYVTGMVTARSTSNYDLDCDELKEDYVNICLEVKALMNDDPSLCNPDDFLCTAFVARDPSLCDKTSDEYHKNTCSSIFSTDPMDCLTLGSGRDIRCLSRKAVLFDNPSFCDELSGTSRSLCYDTLVILTRNTSLCGEGNVGCYGVIDLAIMSQDPSLCEKTFKRECYQTVYSETTLNSITQIFCDKINESDIRESCYRVASYWKKKPGFNNKYCEEDSDCISSSIDCVPGCWNRDRAQFTTKRCAFEEPQLSNCSCKNNICVTS